MEHTRAEKMQLIPKVGDSLLTNHRRAILTILEVQTYNQLCAYVYRPIQPPTYSYLVLLPETEKSHLFPSAAKELMAMAKLAVARSPTVKHFT